MSEPNTTESSQAPARTSEEQHAAGNKAPNPIIALIIGAVLIIGFLIAIIVAVSPALAP